MVRDWPQKPWGELCMAKKKPCVSPRKKHGSLNVPIEHHPTIRYMVYNGYYKVMSNIPKMGHLPIPEKPELLPRSWDSILTGTATKVMGGIAASQKSSQLGNSPGHIRLENPVCFEVSSKNAFYRSLQYLPFRIRVDCTGGLTLFPSFSMVLPCCFQWFSHFPMVLPRFFHVFTTFFPFSHGFPMIFPWFCQGFYHHLPGLDLFKGALDDLTQLRDTTCAQGSKMGPSSKLLIVME